MKPEETKSLGAQIKEAQEVLERVHAKAVLRRSHLYPFPFTRMDLQLLDMARQRYNRLMKLR